MLRKKVFPNISTIKGRRFFKSVARFIVCPLPLCERREGLFFEMWENSKTKYKIAKKIKRKLKNISLFPMVL